MQLLKPGATFGGRYEVVRVLSTGGMGVVYEVLHRDTQRHRAMKVMLPQMMLDDDMRARFKREGIVTAGIESEHLVEVLDVGIDEETSAPFLVMELLRGEDLGARLKRGDRTPTAELLEIFGQIARGLERTHAAGIVHRDLKPENLFVTRRDDGSMWMKILDFGIAKLVDLGASKPSRSVGTPLYMAAEQFSRSAGGIGPPCDIYALGHIAFTLLTGTAYYDTGEDLMALMYKVSQGARMSATARAAELGVTLPRSFDAWFAQSTSADPRRRFGSVREQTAALREALQGADENVAIAASAARMAAALEATEPFSPAEGPTPSFESARSLPAKEHGAGTVPARSEQSLATTGAAPSTRTLRTDSPSRGRSTIAVLGAGALIVGAAVVYRTVSAPSAAPEVPALPATDAPPAPAALPVQPSVEVESADAAVVPAPTSASATPGASATAAASASVAPAATPKPGPLRPAAPASPKPSASAPPPAPTVWEGPRK
ncbi:MAG: serine/threonine-protein kinase [Polyangiaceae bacterium]